MADARQRFHQTRKFRMDFQHDLQPTSRGKGNIAAKLQHVAESLFRPDQQNFPCCGLAAPKRFAGRPATCRHKKWTSSAIRIPASPRQGGRQPARPSTGCCGPPQNRLSSAIACVKVLNRPWQIADGFQGAAKVVQGGKVIRLDCQYLPEIRNASVELPLIMADHAKIAQGREIARPDLNCPAETVCRVIQFARILQQYAQPVQNIRVFRLDGQRPVCRPPWPRHSLSLW